MLFLVPPILKMHVAMVVPRLKIFSLLLLIFSISLFFSRFHTHTHTHFQSLLSPLSFFLCSVSIFLRLKHKHHLSSPLVATTNHHQHQDPWLHSKPPIARHHRLFLIVTIKMVLSPVLGSAKSSSLPHC